MVFLLIPLDEFWVFQKCIQNGLQGVGVVKDVERRLADLAVAGEFGDLVDGGAVDIDGGGGHRLLQIGFKACFARVFGVGWGGQCVVMGDWGLRRDGAGGVGDRSFGCVFNGEVAGIDAASFAEASEDDDGDFGTEGGVEVVPVGELDDIFTARFFGEEENTASQNGLVSQGIEVWRVEFDEFFEKTHDEFAP